MPYFYIVVTAASAGGITALRAILGALLGDLAAALFIVQHIGPHHSTLPEILTRAGPLPVAHGRDGQVFQRGRVYVAPPDYHMVLGGT